MIEPIPPRFVRSEPRFKLTISKALEPGVEYDEILKELEANKLQAWRVPGGFIVTELQDETFCILYVAGHGLKHASQLIAELETVASTGNWKDMRGKKSRAVVIPRARKGWLRLLPDYQATPTQDGKFSLRKDLHGRQEQ